MRAKTVFTERTGRVLNVRLDNPPRNFMTGGMVRELNELVRSLEGERSIGAVVITGAMEDVFITHFDVAEILRGSEGVGPTVSSTVAGGTLRAAGAISRVPGAKAGLERTPAAGLVALRDIHELFLNLQRLDKVVIAAINGMAMGGGCELTLACDIRLMADGEYRIGLPEATLGIIPGAGGTQRLSRLLGPGRAIEMMLEGRVLRPREALEVGLVHEVLPSERLLDEAAGRAERLARRSRETVGGIKRAVYEGGSRPLEDGLHIERAEFLAAASTPAARRAMKAYSEEVASRDEVAPWETDELIRPWQEGTAVDMTAD
jgi:enoyl-CoA hydratase